MKLNTSTDNPILSRFFSGTKFFLLGAVLVLASCKKESDIGADIQPDSDLIDLQASDSLTLKTYTVKEDSLRSDEPGIIQIGTINDVAFGKTTASLFTQFVIPNNLLNIDFGAGAVLDSSALSLSFDSDYYGDTLAPQNFHVYQMTGDIYHDSLYYSNHATQCYPTFAGRVSVGDTLQYYPHPRSKVIMAGDTFPPHLRIPIKNSFASQIFSQSGGTNLSSTAAFLQYLKGLYIESENPGLAPGQGSLLRFNLSDTMTRFTLYYHLGAVAKSFSFVINATTASYSYFTHDYSGLTNSLAQQLANPGVNNSNEVYVSACAGVKTKIEFPYLENLRNLGYSIAINKAELVIKADNPSTITDDFPLNKQLYVVSINESGNQELLTDMFESSTYFGGAVNNTTHEYKINIARYFQQLISGQKPNNGLYLKEFDPDQQGRRAILGSSNPNSSYRMYIHLVYTRIN